MKGLSAPFEEEKIKLWQFMAMNLGIAVMVTVLFNTKYLMTWDGIKTIAPNFLLTFILSCSLSYGGYLTDWFLDIRLAWVKFPLKRLLATVVLYSIYSFLTSFIIITLYVWIKEQFSFADIPWKILLQESRMPMIIALVIMAIFTTNSWLTEWRKAAIEAEQLKIEKISSQYQSLKNQLNPHFLFNSLNALTNLVYENAGKSAKFIEQLSLIYRHVLDVQQDELVSLDREIDFAYNYLSLQKIRFAENLHYKIEVNNSEALFLPPLSLQILLENALKHNVISKEKPLEINIIQKGQVLWVSNTLQPKITREENSMGIGLANIQKRYSLLSEESPKVSKSDDEFKVELPLLTISK